MDIDYAQNLDYLAWAETKLGVTWAPQAVRWVAGRDAGGVAWVVVFSHFSSTNCLLSIATDGSKRWASRSMFKVAFGLPFRQWRLQRVTFVVSERNEASLRMMRKGGRFSIGATEEGRMRMLFDDGSDGIVFGLLKKECRWI